MKLPFRIFAVCSFFSPPSNRLGASWDREPPGRTARFYQTWGTVAPFVRYLFLTFPHKVR